MSVDAHWDWRPADTAPDRLRDNRQRVLEDVLRVANQKVPVDTGALRASGHIVRGAIVYDAEYAFPVHERIDVRHFTGEAKWLERAFLERSNNYDRLIAEGFRL